MNTNAPSWNIDGKELPLFPFDVPSTITLQNGTKHLFRLPDTQTEKRRESLLKTVVVTSAAIINGENPRDIKTDYSKSVLAYYGDMIDKISGVEFNGNSPEDWIDAQQEVEVEGEKVKVYQLLSAAIRKAAAGRLYGGRVELEKPEEEDEDIDPYFGDEEDEDITAKVQKAEARKEVYKLTLHRSMVIRQQFGVEFLPNGRMSEPTHIVRYHFNEPEGDDFSKWELRAFNGNSLPLNKGGEKSERFYNLDTIEKLFDKLITKIEGASVHGESIGELSPDRKDAHRKTMLANVPLAIKKLTIATLFSEASNVGNA